MKKRIFISIHYMEIGGAEISLIGLLQALDYSKYDVDLFLYSHQGEMAEFIPKEVNLLPEIPAYAHIERPMKEALLHGQIGILAGRLKSKWLIRQYLRRKHGKSGEAVLQYVARCVEPHLPSLEKYGEYDLAISFLHPHNYVLSKVRAKKKVCWIHTDYSTIDVNVELELPIWRAYDQIMSISEEAKNAFIKKFPTLENKVEVMENILSPDFVRKRSELVDEEDVHKEMPREKGVVNILSVGRFSDAKNYDNVPDICRRINYQLSIVNCQFRVCWYLIGFGGDEALIREKIKEAGMRDNVIILGKRSNPYPYIKFCDIYCQPSRYEGKSVTVREAQMLCKPVVVTNYPTAMSQIQHEIDGVIVPLNNEECAQGIADFIQNKRLQSDIVGYLKQHDYGNMKEIVKLYRLIN